VNTTHKLLFSKVFVVIDTCLCFTNNLEYQGDNGDTMIRRFLLPLLCFTLLYPTQVLAKINNDTEEKILPICYG